jgi:hypothetical protein
MTPLDHVYRWKKYRPDLFGQRCRVLARGAMNSVLIEFADGTRHCVSRYAVRKAT